MPHYVLKFKLKKIESSQQQVVVPASSPDEAKRLFLEAMAQEQSQREEPFWIELTSIRLSKHQPRVRNRRGAKR